MSHNHSNDLLQVVERKPGTDLKGKNNFER